MKHRSALIIDDDPLFQVVVEEALLAAGIARVQCADDGAIGVACIAEQPDQFDLVVCDLQMPNLDGVGVMRELAALNFAGTVIILSGEDTGLIRTVYNMSRMLGVRMAGCLRKPFKIDEFNALLLKDPQEAVATPNTMTREEIVAVIRKRQIVPFYQPQINVRTNKVAGFEVLARLTIGDVQGAAPMEHLRAAERFGLMSELTLMMIDQVITDLDGWQSTIGPMRIALNLSPIIVSDTSFPDQLIARFRERDIDPSLITLEITEERLLENKVAVLEVLSRLRLAGFRLSVDDFGTGATSIEQLRLFPFTELKIDRQFVQGASDDAFAKMGLQASATFAAMLDMTVVAEGVETEDALNLAIQSGADEVQGYFYARAMPASKVVGWVKSFLSRARAA